MAIAQSGMTLRWHRAVLVHFARRPLFGARGIQEESEKIGSEWNLIKITSLIAFYMNRGKGDKDGLERNQVRDRNSLSTPMYVVI